MSTFNFLSQDLTSHLSFIQDIKLSFDNASQILFPLQTTGNCVNTM